MDLDTNQITVRKNPDVDAWCIAVFVSIYFYLEQLEFYLQFIIHFFETCKYARIMQACEIMRDEKSSFRLLFAQHLSDLSFQIFFWKTSIKRIL